jgi:hypothetical protein
VNEVAGYELAATDGQVGTVSDFLVETEPWALRYFVVDTRKWLPGGSVLLSVDWIEGVRWSDRAVRVDVERAVIKACPPYDPSQPVNRKYEEHIYDYYGRPHYWRRPGTGA